MPTLKSKAKVNPNPKQVEDPHLRELALKQDQVVAYIALTLQRGATASTTSFPVHSGLVIALRNCYTNNNPKIFCTVLTTYLLEASTHLPHCLPQEEVSGLITRLQELFEQVSFSYVACYLLRGLPL